MGKKTARSQHLHLMQNKNAYYGGAMKNKSIKKTAILLICILIVLLSFSSCGGSGVIDSGDPAYEAQVITIEGLNNTDSGADLSLTEITIEELRRLPQYELDASYKRTTGMTEEFRMTGPYLKEVIEYLGGNLDEYEGIGVIGSDSYYCLLSREVIDSTPDLMLALTIDGEAKLDEDNAPARLAVQGQFGPYWVKRVEKIILYDEIPEKFIESVWVFKNLAEGIEPYEYEYYGSKDNAIDLEQIFSRLDHIDYKAFFTMKSADGFKKNEVINIVKSRYYIKIDGKDAPTNVSPYIKLGMNVQNIAWISTNADAAIFPEKMIEYLDTKEIGGQTGIPLDEVLYETEVKAVKSETFDIIGTEGEKITVPGADMSRVILVPKKDGGAGIVWDEDAGYENIDSILRIRLVKKENEGTSDDDAGSAGSDGQGIPQTGENRQALNIYKPDADTIITITGNGVESDLYLSLNDLKMLNDGYVEQLFSTVNNYPTKKFAAAKGIKLLYLLEQAGIKNTAKTIQVAASDGYKAVFTKEQLYGDRYCYLELLSGSTDGRIIVVPMLAWAFGEGKDISKAEDCDIRLVIGQNGISDVNTAASVQMVTKITVSEDVCDKWNTPQAYIDGGKITLQHDNIDQVKLYYTLDGSDPTVNSKVYNPSTTYFQPDLIKPIPVNGSGTLKAIAVGYGKYDSEVLKYDY